MSAYGLLARILAIVGIVLFAVGAQADDEINVGVLRFVSSGGVFLAQERGYFKAAGLNVHFIYFQAAEPISVAVASGDIAFGVTAITAGTLNLAGKGAVKIIASQGAERKGYKGTQILVSKSAFERGITSLDKLPGTSVAITQIGSSQHYMMGQVAVAEHFDLAKIALKPLQGIPNMVAALKTGQVDAALVPPQFASPLLASGSAHLLANFSDIANYQYGGVFTAPKLIETNPDLVKRFVAAYQHGNADYSRAFLQKDAKGETMPNDETKTAAALIAKYVFANEPGDKALPKIIASAVFVDASGALDLADIERQLAWYKSEKLVSQKVEAKAFIDTSFAH